MSSRVLFDAIVKTQVALVVLIAATIVGDVCAASPPPNFEQIERAIKLRPVPEYPPEALARYQAGSGVVKLHFKVKTGAIRTIQLTQSTGYKLLDVAAMKAFGQWRLKPGALPPIKSFSSAVKEPFADEDFVMKIPFTFALAYGGRVHVGHSAPGH